MTAPDLTTEVVGYRQWYVTPALELRSAGVTSADPWNRGDNTAKCARVKEVNPNSYAFDTAYQPNPCGDCPGPNCECGFYALHDPSDHWYGKSGTRAGMLAFAFTQPTDPLVSGIIVAWGALQVHHQGFRAQHARIAALALPETKRDQAVARAVAAVYGVPCVPSNELPGIASEYGGTVPVEYRPDKPKPKPATSLAQLVGGYAVGGNANTWTWTTPLHTVPPQPKWYVNPAPPSGLWTPADEVDAPPEDKLAKYRKPPANRQGPPKPKRAPKKLGGR